MHAHHQYMPGYAQPMPAGGVGYPPPPHPPPGMVLVGGYGPPPPYAAAPAGMTVQQVAPPQPPVYRAATWPPTAIPTNKADGGRYRDD